MDKHGSRVVDVVWTHSELGRKEQLATVLLANEGRLTTDYYGGIVLRNCNIAQYRKQQAGWLDRQKAAGKKRQLFEELLNEEHQIAAPKKKKKKKTFSKDDDLLVTPIESVDTVEPIVTGKKKMKK